MYTDYNKDCEWWASRGECEKKPKLDACQLQEELQTMLNSS